MQYQHDPRDRRVGEAHTIWKWLQRALDGKSPKVTHASQSTGSFYVADSDDDADIIDDHGDLAGLTDTADHPGYLTLDGLRTMLGNLLMGAFGIHLTKRATPATPASEVTVLYNDTTTERLHQLDDTGAAADLSKQIVVTLQGQQLGLHADSETWKDGDTQNLPCTVTPYGFYSYNITSNIADAGHGAWLWVARRDISDPNFAQAWLATGGQMDYRGCNTLKVRALVLPTCSVQSGSVPSGGSYWDSIKLYMNEQAGASKDLSADLQSQTSNGNWSIIEADFDVSGWATGDDDGLMFGIELIGVDVDDPDPDPINEWQYSFVVAWIEVIGWIR